MPRELEHYIVRARRLRSETIARWLRAGFGALARLLRRTRRRPARPDLPVKGTLAGS